MFRAGRLGRPRLAVSVPRSARKRILTVRGLVSALWDRGLMDPDITVELDAPLELDVCDRGVTGGDIPDGDGAGEWVMCVRTSVACV